MIPILTSASFIPEDRDIDENPTLLDDGSVAKGVDSLPVADAPAPDLAVRAAREALKRTNRHRDSISLTMHCSVFHQGHHRWSPTHYIHEQLGLNERCVPVGISMLCSGGAVALQVAAGYLAAGDAALITSGERYRGPAWDRWETHPDIGYGDGAAAVVIGSSAEPSEYAISAVSQRTDSRLEGIERGDRPFTELPGAWPTGEELSNAREEFYSRVGRDMLRESAVTHMAACAEEALGQASCPEIAFAVPPRLGPRLQRVLFGEALRSLDTNWRQLGRNSGHMGAGDSLVAIAQIMEGELLKPGQSAAVIGGGGGFTWSCLIVTRH